MHVERGATQREVRDEIRGYGVMYFIFTQITLKYTQAARNKISKLKSNNETC
jgi:hypothetical protein